MVRKGQQFFQVPIPIGDAQLPHRRPFPLLSRGIQMPQRAMRSAEIVVGEVERHMRVQTILALGEPKRLPRQSLVLLTDGEVTSLDERGGDAGPASILSEYLPLLHLYQMPVPMMFDDLGVSETVIRNQRWISWPAAQASSRECGDVAVELQ